MERISPSITGSFWTERFLLAKIVWRVSVTPPKNNWSVTLTRGYYLLVSKSHFHFKAPWDQIVVLTAANLAGALFFSLNFLWSTRMHEADGQSVPQSAVYKHRFYAFLQVKENWVPIKWDQGILGVFFIWEWEKNARNLFPIESYHFLRCLNRMIINFFQCRDEKS